MKSDPLVSIICLCYNHGQHVARAIRSAMDQTFKNTELIVVDDASGDDSREVIEKLSKIHGFRTIFNEENLGNCRAFNRGLAVSKGKYIIDLAADDELLPGRVAEGVGSLEQRGERYGVHFCDVELVDKDGKTIGTHFARDGQGRLIRPVEQGDLYKTLLEKYYIPAPAMMMRRSVLEALGGYDENLSYEDFDFWVRSSRHYKYAFSDKVLMRKYVLGHSLSASRKLRKNPHSLSTAIVCQKALKLNRDEDENEALLKRVNYELKWALATEHWQAAAMLLDIKKQLGDGSPVYLLQKLAVSLKPPWHRVLKHFM